MVNDHVSLQFKSAAERLANERPDLWDGIAMTVEYLRQFRRHAVAPDVRWGIAQSIFGSNCGEIRWPDPEVQEKYLDDAWRGLFVAHPDEDWYVFTVLGNKATDGNRWYDRAVPISDAVVRAAIAKLHLRPLRPE